MINFAVAQTLADNPVITFFVKFYNKCPPVELHVKLVDITHFQTTKEGKFKGANTFQHDVDSVIEVPERGKAVQYGRFNQGGEMPIF